MTPVFQIRDWGSEKGNGRTALHTKCSVSLAFPWKETQSRRGCAGNASSDRTVASGS